MLTAKYLTMLRSHDFIRRERESGCPAGSTPPPLEIVLYNGETPGSYLSGGYLAIVEPGGKNSTAHGVSEGRIVTSLINTAVYILPC